MFKSLLQISWSTPDSCEAMGTSIAIYPQSPLRYLDVFVEAATGISIGIFRTVLDNPCDFHGSPQEYPQEPLGVCKDLRYRHIYSNIPLGVTKDIQKCLQRQPQEYTQESLELFWSIHVMFMEILKKLLENPLEYSQKPLGTCRDIHRISLINEHI